MESSPPSSKLPESSKLEPSSIPSLSLVRHRAASRQAGNATISNKGEYTIVEIPASGAPQFTLPLLSNESSLLQVAVDASGDVFVADFGQDGIVELPWTGTGYGQQFLVGRGMSGPLAVTVDGSGNLFVVTDGFSGWGVKVPAGCADISCEIVLGPDGALVGLLAVDGLGDLFAPLSNVNLVYEYPAGGGAPFAVGSGFVEPQAVTVDSAGDLFIAGEALPGPLIEVLRSQPPILAFVGTGADGTGASSPQSVQIQNIGNAALSLSGLSVSENFSLVPGSGTPADCTSSSSLSPGVACNLSISFTPQSTGELSGTVTLSDNSLNSKPASQTIHLTGNFPLAQVSPASLAFGAVVSPGTKTLPLSITNIGGSTLTIASTSIDGPSYTVSGSTCDAGVPAGKSCTLQILFSVMQGDIDYHQDSLTITTNAPAAAAVTVPMTGSGAGLAYFSDELNFGTISANSQESLPVTLFNQGVAAGETLKFSINGPSYTIPAATNGCSSVTLSSGGSGCQLMVLFKPVGPGYHHDHLTVTPSSGGALSITLHGTAD